MASRTVLHSLTLPGLLDRILTAQPGSTATSLIVCSTREDFLQDLIEALHPTAEEGSRDWERLVTPTLHNLLAARRVRVVFCAAVPSLLAHLTAYDGWDAEKEKLVLVNPLTLHATTCSFSAQGLSRTFAAAVETASRLGAVLEVIECRRVRRSVDGLDEGEQSMDAAREAGVGRRDGETRDGAPEDPWEQDVSILNVSARKFGAGLGERSWVGRTVKVKRIAARWFHFQKIHDDHDRGQPG